MTKIKAVDRLAEGEKAALGPRSTVKRHLRRLRSVAVRVLIKVHTATVARGRTPDHVEFVPAASSPSEFADLAGRVGWYLAELRLPVCLKGPHGTPRDAPWLEARYVERGLAVVNRSDLSQSIPHRLVHRVRLATTVRCLLSRAPITTVDPRFFNHSEGKGYTKIRGLYGSGTPDLSDGFARFLDLVSHANSAERRALVVATGPSATELDLSRASEYDVRITCNSAVRNRDFLEALRPHVIAFADPVFHMGPSRYASAFRDDVTRAADLTGALLLVREADAELLIRDIPALRSRIVGFRTSSRDWSWPDHGADSFQVCGTANVLTLAMLPAAFATAMDVHIAGCDGRAPGERYFWRHNKQLQYSDDLMKTAFAAHPAFFRDRNYRDYYRRHCAELESQLSHAERSGRNVRSLTSSHIPALQRRGSQRPA